MNQKQHPIGARVCSIFEDSREGVVIESGPESNPTGTLIEFVSYDQDEGAHFTHRKWLPTRHWRQA